MSNYIYSNRYFQVSFTMSMYLSYENFLAKTDFSCKAYPSFDAWCSAHEVNEVATVTVAQDPVPVFEWLFDREDNTLCIAAPEWDLQPLEDEFFQEGELEISDPKWKLDGLVEQWFAEEMYFDIPTPVKVNYESGIYQGKVTYKSQC